MVNDDLVARIEAELRRRLEHAGLGGIPYKTDTFSFFLIFCFDPEKLGEDKCRLLPVAKAVYSKFRKEMKPRLKDIDLFDPGGSPEDLEDDDDEDGDGSDTEDEEEEEEDDYFATWPSIGFEVREGYWYEGEVDRKMEEEERREAEEEAAEEAAYRAAHPFEYLPIPPPPKRLNPEVYLTLAYEFYDAIERGEKKGESREYREYYVKKLLSQPLKTVRFQRGYGGPGHDAPRQMRWSIKDIIYYNAATDEKAPVDNPPAGFEPTHIAIVLGDRID